MIHKVFQDTLKEAGEKKQHKGELRSLFSLVY